ncbi:MAG: tetratricopeptide repeat protein [Elusimicrobiales bacterium]
MNIASALRRPGAAKHVIASALIALLTLAAFWPALRAGFINWDDPDYLHNNPAVVAPGWGKVFAPVSAANSLVLYQPLTFLSYRLEYMAAGLKPAVYHADNVALHIINGIAFYWLALELGLAFPAAAFAAALFAVHPAHAESVSWISGRKDLLCSFFFLFSLLAYLRGRLAASAVLYAAAMLSKPTIAGGAFIFPLLDWHRGRAPDRKMFLEKLPFFLAAAAAILLTFKTGGGLISRAAHSGGAGLADRFALCGHGLLFYLGKLLFPAKLSAIYPLVWLPDNIFLKYLPSAAFIGAAFCFFRLQVLRPYAFGLGFFALAVSQMLPFGEVFPADRYIYIAAAGVFLAAGVLFGQAYAKAKIPAAVCAAALILACGWLCFDRAKLWGDPPALWSDALRQKPVWSGSVKLFRATFLPYVLYNRGNTYLERKEYMPAQNDFTAALELNPYQAAEGLYNNRGMTYAAMGRHDLAAADFTKAIAAGDSSVYHAYLNRGLAYCNLKRYSEAMADFNKAAELQPVSMAWDLRGQLYLFVLMRYDKAAEDFEKAVKLEPQNPQTQNHLGVAYLALNRYDAAAQAFGAALAVAPDFAQAYVNRGIAYGRGGKHAQALEDFNKALSLEPGNPAALAGRRMAESSLGAKR